jgi:hypothetical protein
MNSRCIVGLLMPILAPATTACPMQSLAISSCPSHVMYTSYSNHTGSIASALCSSAARWKGKVVPLHCMKVQRGSGVIAPLVHNLSIVCNWLVSFPPQPSYPWTGSPGIQWTGGWVDPTAGLDISENRRISFPCLDSNSGLCSPYPNNYTNWATRCLLLLPCLV